MALSKLTGLQAFSHMKQMMINHVSGVRGYCHKTCQNAWGLPVKYASALDAWNHVPLKARHGFLLVNFLRLDRQVIH